MELKTVERKELIVEHCAILAKALLLTVAARVMMQTHAHKTPVKMEDVQMNQSLLAVEISNVKLVKPLPPAQQTAVFLQLQLIQQQLLLMQ